MEIASPLSQYARILKTDGSENGNSPEDCGTHEGREGTGLLPGDVARRIPGTDSGRTSGTQIRRSEISKAQRQLIADSKLLPFLAFPGRFDAKGTEHVVRFKGLIVEKHQHSDAWVPVIDRAGMLGIETALPSEYLRRLELQNELFGDHIRVVGLTRANRFVISQPTLRGGEPGENEIRDLLLEAGWQRVPIQVQNLPIPLMGAAWWHDAENLVLLDARKPNFKLTDYGVLPIDLILADLSQEMRSRFTFTAGQFSD